MVISHHSVYVVHSSHRIILPVDHLFMHEQRTRRCGREPNSLTARSAWRPAAPQDRTPQHSTTHTNTNQDSALTQSISTQRTWGEEMGADLNSGSGLGRRGSARSRFIQFRQQRLALERHRTSLEPRTTNTTQHDTGQNALGQCTASNACSAVHRPARASERASAGAAKAQAKRSNTNANAKGEGTQRLTRHTPCAAHRIDRGSARLHVTSTDGRSFHAFDFDGSVQFSSVQWRRRA